MYNNRLTWLLLMLYVLVPASTAFGYPVGIPLPLDKLELEAAIIFKGEAIATVSIEDELLKPISGYAARETRFKVISQVKGEVGGEEIQFRHYDEAPDSLGVGMYTPQFYHFEAGRSYLVCAKNSATGARQTRLGHTMKMDLGVLRCRDRRPVTAKALPETYWAELLVLRESPVPADVLYAIQQMDEMSKGSENYGSGDFSRVDVLGAVRGLIARPEPEIAQAAIGVIGAGCPYLSDERAPYWLGTVGVATPGLAQIQPGLRNAGGTLCWRELVAVANSNAAPETRALAIRALGLVKADGLRKIMDPWLKAPESVVRAAAVILFADFAVPHEYTTGLFAKYAADKAPEVRNCAAYSIGFMQNADMVPVLSTLLKDEDAKVRRAAMESLHSFRPEIPAVAAALKADLENPESQPLSLLALARENPGAHLEALARVIEEKITPANGAGSQTPAFTAWKLLFKHLRSQPAADLRAGKWDRYLDALEKVGQGSSSEPRAIYAFYLHLGMPERAGKYRAAAKKAATYDVDYYFNMADKNPAAYLTD